MLLSNSEDLKGREKLDAALRLNRPLFDAYYLKEDLRQIWMQLGKDER